MTLLVVAVHDVRETLKWDQRYGDSRAVAIHSVLETSLSPRSTGGLSTEGNTTVTSDGRRGPRTSGPVMRMDTVRILIALARSCLTVPIFSPFGGESDVPLLV